MKLNKYILLFFLAMVSSKILGVTITFKSDTDLQIEYEGYKENPISIKKSIDKEITFDKELFLPYLQTSSKERMFFIGVDANLPINKDSTIEIEKRSTGPLGTGYFAKIYETRGTSDEGKLTQSITEQKDTSVTTFIGSYNNSEFGFGNLSYMCNGKVFPITTGRTAENSYLQTNKIDNLDAACANSGALLLNSDDGGDYSTENKNFTFIFRNVPLKIGQQNKIEYYAGVPGGFIMIVNGTPVSEGLVTIPPDVIKPGLLWGDSVIRGLSIEDPEVIAASSTQPSQIKNPCTGNQIFVDGSCQDCPVGSTTTDNKYCLCPKNEVVVDGACKCYKRDENGSCIYEGPQ